MADSVYQPIVSDDDTESETPSPQVELDVVDPAEFRRRPDDQGDDLSVEDAAAQRSHRPDPESAESAFERPITVHKVKGDGPMSVTEAADALRWSRGYKLGADLRESGLSERQLDEIVADTLERAERIDPLMPPPPEAKVLDRFGKEGEPLTVAEAADQLTDWRARHQEAQQAELAELVGEAEQARQAEAQQAQQPQPEPQPQPQPRPTPEQRERALVAAERQWITQLKRMEGTEAAARNDYDQLVQAVVAEFPSLQTALPTPEQIEDLRVRDPAQFERLAHFDRALRERQQRVAAIAQQRGVHEQQQAQINAQARAAARAAEDKAFEQLAAQHIPGWERVHGEVRQQARKTLEAAGLSEAQIQRLWTGDESIDAHSSVLQLVLAKAAQWDLAHQRAHQIRQTPMPQVQRPGTYRARDDGADSVRELSARLSRASGREAIRLGTALTKARRASGG